MLFSRNLEELELNLYYNKETLSKMGFNIFSKIVEAPTGSFLISRIGILFHFFPYDLDVSKTLNKVLPA